MTAQSTTPDTARTGWHDLLAGRNAIYSVTLAGGVMLHAVNIYIVTTVMPSVVKEIGGLDYYAWSTTIFVVASILGSALSVHLLRGVGPRGAYAVAAALFAVGTLTCSFAPNMAVLLGGRAVQGLGGGLLYALAYSVIRVVLPASLWSRAIGLISAMWGVSTLVGPAIGGVFAEFDIWRAAFWSLVPIVSIFGAMAVFVLPGRDDNHAEVSALPLPQLLLLAGSVLVVSAGSVGSGMAWNLGGLILAVGMIAVIIWFERRSATRLLPGGTFSQGSRLGTTYATIAFLVVSMQPDLFVPYFLQVLHGQAPLVSGYLAALTAIGWTTASLMSSNRTSASPTSALGSGPIVVLVGMIVLGITLPINGGGDWLVLAPACVGLFLLGFGIGLAWPRLVTSVFQNAPAAEQDLAAGGVTTVQLSATAFGAALAGMIANAAGISHPGGVEGASTSATWLFVAFAVAPVIVAVIARRIVGSEHAVRTSALTGGH